MSPGPVRRPGRSLLIRIARWSGGTILILAGLLLSIPGIPGPGVLLVLLGVLVLLPESPWLRKKYVAMRRRCPRAFEVLERWRRRRLPRRPRPGRDAA